MFHHRQPRRTRFATLVTALVLCAAAALLAPGPARAGFYTVTQCSELNPGPGGSLWERTTDHYRQRTRCAAGQGLQIYHDAGGSALGNYGAWIWRAPAGTVFTHVQANASLTHQAGHRGELVAVRPSGEHVRFGAEHNDFRVHAIAGEFGQFHTWLRCTAPGAGQPCGRAGADSAHAYVHGVFLRTADRSAPALTLTGGSVFDGPVIRGVRGLAFSAADQGGGIRKVYVEANGSLVRTDIRNCAVLGGFATALRPCPPATAEALPIPTADRAFATGPNVVTACVEDLATDGFANRDCEGRQVWVDNACPASSVPASGPLSASFAGADSTLVRSDRPAVLSGRLSGTGAGATVCALTRVRVAGAPIVVGATGLTRGDGSYEIELPAGAGRDVFVHHAFGDRVIARHGLTLRASARPTLRVRPNRRVRPRDRLHFRGVIPGPACFDRVVKVQARVGKRRWQVFRTDRADAGCRFAARYKLRATRRARRYRFRALVPQQAGYPFERGHSALARVWLKRRGR